MSVYGKLLPARLVVSYKRENEFVVVFRSPRLIGLNQRTLEKGLPDFSSVPDDCTLHVLSLSLSCSSCALLFTCS